MTLKADTYYWIKFSDESSSTVGYYDDVWKNTWSIIGSDEVFSGKEFEVICEIQKPPATAKPNE